MIDIQLALGIGMGVLGATTYILLSHLGGKIGENFVDATIRLSLGAIAGGLVYATKLDQSLFGLFAVGYSAPVVLQKLIDIKQESNRKALAKMEEVDEINAMCAEKLKKDIEKREALKEDEKK